MSHCLGVAGTSLVTLSNGKLHYKPNFASVTMYGISCPSSLVCYAVGGTELDGASASVMTTVDGGKRWTEQRNLGHAILHSISCPSVTTCYAVGDKYVPVQYFGEIIWTTDGGKTWGAQDEWGDMGTQGTHLMGIACPNTSTCYAAGYWIDGGWKSQPLVVTTADGGTHWLLRSPQERGAQLEAITCLDASTCYAVGHSNLDRYLLAVTRNGGLTWVTVATPLDSALGDLWAVACRGTVCTAVGSFGAILTTDDDGRTWRSHTKEVDVSLTGIACPTPKVCFAVGSTRAGVSVVVHTSDAGRSWRSQQMPPGLWIKSIACPTTAWCYGVGSQGEVVTTKDGGATWRSQATGAKGFLSAISCPSTFDCFAVECSCPGSPEYDVLHTADGGQHWDRQAIPIHIGLGLSAIRCPTKATCYAVGDNYILSTKDADLHWRARDMHLDGGLGTNGNGLSDIGCPVPTVCYAVAPAGGREWTGAMILGTTNGGKSWETQYDEASSGQSPELAGVACADARTCYVVGERMLATADGGAH